MPLPTWARAARMGLLGAWVLVAALHLGLPATTRLETWNLSYLFLEVLAGASLGYRAWISPRSQRLAWWLLAASAFLEIPNLLVVHQAHRGLFPEWTTALTGMLSLGTGILVLAGVLSFPRGRERGGMARRRILDSLIFATSLMFLLWVMGLQAALRAPVQGLGLRAIADYLNVAMLGGGLIFMTSYEPERVRGPLGWLGASAAAWLVGLSCWTLAGLPKVVATEGWIILAGGIPLFQGLAAWSPRSVLEASAKVPSQRQLAGLLPYLPAALAVLVLGVLLIGAPRSLTPGALAAFLVMVVLLLLRQLQAIEDLLAARRTLEGRVLERTQSLERAQDLLLRTERMNSTALMGAGLAHDLNNLLAAIKSSAELMALEGEAGTTQVQKHLDRISHAADHAAQLTGRLMAFARREAEALAPLDLAEVLTSLEATLGLLLPRSVALQVEVLSDSPWMVHSSRLRLEQMVVNLVANAKDAMPGGGKLTLRLGASAEGGIRLDVMDTGSGMTPEVRARIFEPFFTTKGPGKGTGLGLPSLKAMVEEAGGRLEVESEVGQGTCFTLFLPRAEAALSE